MKYQIKQTPTAKLIRFIFISLFFSVLFTSITYSQSIEVCSSCPVTSIQEAINRADSAAVITVKKGVYREIDIVIDKPLQLLAEKGAIIDGENKGEIIVIAADNVRVDGFEIINVGRSRTRDFSAIRTKRIQNFQIENLIIQNPFFAIYIEKSMHGVVRNNKVYGDAQNEYSAGNGIHLWHSNHIEVENNEVIQMRDGIYLEFSDFCKMENNTAKDNIRYGLHFMFSQDNKVLGNTFSNSGAGIAIMFSKRMEMHHNTFKDNWGNTAYGVLLKEATDSKITHNVFERNTTGINIEVSNRIIYEHNDFKGNGWAVNARGANYENKFTKNNFLNNSFDLAYNGGINQNSFNGNYWSDYTGYDLDKDGVGDVPYRPVKLFSYMVNKSPEAIILLRSMFVDIVDFAEKISPVFTPDQLVDETPSMKIINHDKD